MKIAILTPDRGDRNEFNTQYMQTIEKQTMQPDRISWLRYAPKSDKVDITERYRIGYEALSKTDCDAILFMEIDDYYAENYIETIVYEWINVGKPDLFGTTYTYFYNIRTKEYFKFTHHQRSMAMATLIKPNLNINWGADENPYTDVTLYSQLNYKLFTPEKPICIGIKHGIGLCGGAFHNTNMETYKTHGTQDKNMDFLKQHVDKESFEFYKNLFAN